MDLRVFALTPGSWEILRHIDTAGKLPIKLLTKVAGDLDDIVSLFWWQMLDGWIMDGTPRRFDLEWHGGDRPLYRGAELLNMAAFRTYLAAGDTVLWVEFGGMGQWAEDRIAPCRRALDALRTVDDLPWRDLLRKADCEPDHLFGLDDKGFIQALTPARLRKRDRAKAVGSRDGLYAHAVGEARSWARPDRPDRVKELVVQITPKGRTYGVARDGALV